MGVNGGRMENYLITGSIVTYNNADIIEKCITSILDCTKDVHFKLYVYDNHSTDGIVELIKSDFPQVEVVEGQDNRGFGYGHNQIIKQVDSKYHVVINPDVFVDTNIIESMSAYMDNHSSIGILMPKVLNPDGSEQFLPKRQPNFKYTILSKFKPFSYYRKIYTGENQNITSPVKCDNISGSFFMIKTDLMQKLNGFDERYFMYFEDADLGRRVKHEEAIVYHPDMYIYHEWKRDNTRSLKGIRIFLTSMFKYIEKWKSF